VDTDGSDKSMLITVGSKLYSLLEKDDRVVGWFVGASVAEEVTSILSQVVSKLTALQDEYGLLTVYCLYHNEEAGVAMQKILPPFQDLLHRPTHCTHPPVLNLSPHELLATLVDQYLLATLHEILYTSLMEENHRRVTHLGGAVRHLDEESSRITRQVNTLRQEEIIEEIKMILLSAASLGENPVR
jgi:F-type H+-transporting ATPase subunit gamma